MVEAHNESIENDNHGGDYLWKNMYFQ